MTALKPWLGSVRNVILVPLNVTLHVPTPPSLVVTMTSPFPLTGPEIAMILFGDFHSADRRQSKPQIVKPR